MTRAVERPGPGRRLGGVLRLTHPFPSVMNALAVLLFAALATGGWPGWGMAARLAATIFAAHASIGIANDLVDRDLDRATKPHKPLVAGVVTPTVALAQLALALAIAGLGAASFGPVSLACVAGVVGAGLLYDFRLKRTPLSWLPYLLALPLQPVWVWAALGRFTPRLLWVYPLGAAPLLALHLANALADVTGDTTAEVGGLVQRLGARRARVLLWPAALLPGALALLLGLALPYRWGRFLPALALSLAPTLVAMALVRRRPGDEAVYRTVFGLLIVGTIVLAVGWLAAAI